MTDDDAPLYDERYASSAEAIAAAQALSKPGDLIEVHANDCEVSEDDTGCTCEPVVLVCVAEVARA